MVAGATIKRRGRGCKRERDQSVEIGARAGNVQIIGAVIVPPVREAVDFIDGVVFAP
jgi:hypothetical protein